MQKAIDNLKAGPKEDKVAVASGIAVSVVVVLLAAWAIYFFHNLQRVPQSLDLSGGAQDQFNFTNITEAQKQLQQEFGNQSQELRNIQQQSADGGNGGQMQTQPMQVQGAGGDQFGAPMQ